MMVTLVYAFVAFDLTVAEKETETMSSPIPPSPETPIALTTTGQQYRQTTPLIYLEVAITESRD